MSKTIVIVGFGPGISNAVAEKFGAEGFAVALVARNPDRLAAGVSALTARGITAAAFPADASDPAALRDALGQARAALGPLTALHWNAYGGQGAGDLLSAAPEAIRGLFDIAVVGLLTAVQAALPDLKSAGDGAVLITNGAFADTTPAMDEYAVSLGSTGVALANAAKYKLTGLLAARLKGEGVTVGEVMIAGTIQGTPWDTAQSPYSIDPARVAEKFWEIFQTRAPLRARIGPL